MVVVGVIAVLLAITLPALHSARIRSHEAIALSNMRGIGVTIEAYATAQRGRYPFHAPFEPYPVDPSGISIQTSDPWGMRYLWSYVVQPVAPWSESYRSWLNVGVAIEDPVRPWNNTTVSYYYSCSFIARPETWSEQSAPPSEVAEMLLAPTFTHEVRAPAAKAMMYDADRAYLARDPTPDDRRAVLTADGAASLRQDSELRPPVQNRYNGITPRLYHDTRNGVRGRDF